MARERIRQFEGKLCVSRSIGAVAEDAELLGSIGGRLCASDALRCERAGRGSGDSYYARTVVIIEELSNCILYAREVAGPPDSGSLHKRTSVMLHGAASSR